MNGVLTFGKFCAKNLHKIFLINDEVVLERLKRQFSEFLGKINVNKIIISPRLCYRIKN